MIFCVRDVVEFYSKIAGKNKYHLCIKAPDALDARHAFLFLNSKNKYNDEVTVPSSDIPFLPKSPTGFSVVSLTLVVWVTESDLRIFSALCSKRTNARLPSGARAMMRGYVGCCRFSVQVFLEIARSRQRDCWDFVAAFRSRRNPKEIRLYRRCCSACLA